MDIGSLKLARIMFVHKHTYAHLGGAEKSTLDLIDHFRECFGETLLLCNKGKLIDETTNFGVSCCEIGWRGCLDVMATALKVLRALAEFRPNIVHIQHRAFCGLFRIYQMLFKYRIVYTQRVEYDTLGLFTFGGDCNVAISEGVRRNMIEFLHFRKESIQMIHTGFREKRNEKRGEKEEGKLGQSELLHLLFVGSLNLRKGITILIEAMSKIDSKVTDGLLLSVAGEGELRSLVERLVDEMGLGGRVAFLGYQEDVSELMTKADCIVLPSLREGLPRVLIEGYLHGTPAIATDIPGCNEVVHRDYGILVPPGDADGLARAIERIYHDREVLPAWGALGKGRVGVKFSFEKMIRAYDCLYRSLIPVEDGSARNRP